MFTKHRTNVESQTAFEKYVFFLALSTLMVRYSENGEFVVASEASKACISPDIHEIGVALQVSTTDSNFYAMSSKNP